MLGNFVSVALGGAVGAVLRYGIGLLGEAIGVSGPMTTMIINISGSFCLGILLTCCHPGSLLLFAGIGLCGSFTTFSTFSTQSVQLLQAGRLVPAALYMTASILLCILSAWIGFQAGNRFHNEGHNEPTVCEAQTKSRQTSVWRTEHTDDETELI